MLSPKKISFRKKIIYYLIIAIMIGGTFFSIYKNYKLASNREAINTDDPSTFVPDPGVSTENKSLNKDNQTKEAVAIQNIDSDVLDVSVLKDPKFLKLQDASVVQPPKIDMGKNNPFEPK